MNIVILDLETTGDNCYVDEICQLSYIILDKNLNIIKSKNLFFKVDYVHFKSNKKKLQIDELRVLSNNKTFKDNYDEIFKDLNNNIIVCHNTKHDIDFIRSEFTRINNSVKFTYEEFCTMKYYKEILKLKGNRSTYKYPKLTEIMPYLNIRRSDIIENVKEIYDINNECVDFHDSRFDVVATYLIVIKTEDIIKRLNRNSDKTNITKRNNSTYKGGVVSNKGNGWGTVITETYRYEGLFTDWKPDLNGSIYFYNGDVYVGELHRLNITGNGKFIKNNGSIYEGQFKDGQPHGFGKLMDKNGDICEGQFVNGKMHGHGKKSYENGDVYEGNFIEGNMFGRGKITYSNGDTFDGEFGLMGIKSKGTFIKNNEEIYEGEFMCGYKHKTGQVTKVNGDVYEVEYFYGELKKQILIKSEDSKEYAKLTEKMKNLIQDKKHVCKNVIEKYLLK